MPITFILLELMIFFFMTGKRPCGSEYKNLADSGSFLHSNFVERKSLPRCTGRLPSFLYPLLLVFVLFAFGGCGRFPFRRDPMTGPFPYEFKPVKELAFSGKFLDLDGDGTTEYIMIDNTYRTYPIRYPNIAIYNDNLEFVEQINFNGRIKFVGAFDVNDDGYREIIAPFSRNDSLFIRIIDHRGNVLQPRDKFIYTGKPRIDSTGTYIWTGDIAKMDYRDLDRDGQKEVILFPNEGYAGAPRGVYVLDGKTFDLIWKYEIGPLVGHELLIYDFNRDGYLEILIPSVSSCNDNQANGTDDNHCYLFMLDHTGKLLWRRQYGGKYTAVSAKLNDYNDDGHSEILAFYRSQLFMNVKIRLDVLDHNGQVLKAFELPYNLGSFSLMQIDHTAEKEIVVATDMGDVLLLNNRLEVLKKAHFESIGNIYSNVDWNGDGFDEVFMNSNDQVYLLDRNLQIVARIPKDYYNKIYWSYFKICYRHNKAPLLAIFREDGGMLFELKNNPNFYLQYYGPFFGTLLLVMLFGTLFAYGRRYYARANYYKRLVTKATELEKDPILLLNPGGKIEYVNEAGRNLLNLSRGDLPVRLVKTSLPFPNLTRELMNLLDRDAIRYEKRIVLDGDSQREFRLVAEPAGERGSKRPNWLVILQDISWQKDLENASAWVAMAQRIAHDIKNPLTSIQLTLQRLQREYQSRESENAQRYDEYTVRILERIENLRRMSRDFMKFLNVEKPNVQPVDLNKLVEELFGNTTIALPGDVKLVLKLASDLPTVHADAEQMQTLLENLVSNAINAMPEGGTLSVSTSVAFNLQFNDNNGPRNYVVLEVMDTGRGIPPEVMERLFHPYITKTYLGTGLGLTIVKKIVDDHHGHIEVNSEEGVGTSFIIYIPVA